MGYFQEWMAHWAWEDSGLLQRAFPGSPEAFWDHCQVFHGTTPQTQLTLHNLVDGCVGGQVLMETFDGQVGPALVAVHTWLANHVRGSLEVQRTLRKMALQECRDQGIRWLILTRQMPDGSNRTTYKEVT